MSEEANDTLRWVLPWALILGLAGLVAWLVQPPAPHHGPVSADQFGVDPGIRVLEQITKTPHPWRSEAAREVHGYLVAQLGSDGYEVETKILASQGRLPTRNIVATKRGTASTGTVLVAAHYDSAPRSHGAADDGAAVAAMLTVAEIIKPLELRNDIVLLITDGEEAGLLGAREMRLANAYPADTKVVLNFEARGASGPSLMFQTHEGNGAWVDVFAEHVERPASNSLMVSIYRMLPNDTDFSEFLRADLRGLNFAFIGSPEHYHEPTDDLEHLDLRSLQHHGDQMLALAQGFGAMDLAQLEHSDDVVHFDIATRVLVVYPIWVAWLLCLLTVLLGAYVLWRDWIQREQPVGVGVLRTLMLWLWLIVLVGGLGWAWLLMQANELSEAAPATSQDPFAYAALLVVALAAVLLGLRTANARGVLLAVTGLLTDALIAMAIFMPGGTFLFQWPVLALWLYLRVHEACGRERPGTLKLRTWLRRGTHSHAHARAGRQPATASRCRAVDVPRHRSRRAWWPLLDCSRRAAVRCRRQTSQGHRLRACRRRPWAVRGGACWLIDRCSDASRACHATAVPRTHDGTRGNRQLQERTNVSARSRWSQESPP